MMEILGAFARNLVQHKDRSREEIRSSAQYMRRRLLRKRPLRPDPVDTRRIADKVTASVASHISRMAAKRREPPFPTYPFFAAPLRCYPPRFHSNPYWNRSKRKFRVIRPPVGYIGPSHYVPIVPKRRLFRKTSPRKQKSKTKKRETVVRSTKLRKGSYDKVRTSGRRRQYIYDSDRDTSPDSTPRGEPTQKPKLLMDYIRELHDHMTEKQESKEMGTERLLKKMSQQLKKHEKALKKRVIEKKKKEKEGKKTGDGDGGGGNAATGEKPKEKQTKKKKDKESSKKSKKVKKTCFIKESVSSVVGSSACKLKPRKKKKPEGGLTKKVSGVMRVGASSPAPLSVKRAAAAAAAATAATALNQLAETSAPMNLKAQVVGGTPP